MQDTDDYFTDSGAKNILQRFLFKIAKDAQYFEGSSNDPISGQFRRALTALLNMSLSNGTTNTSNPPTINEAKVTAYLGGSSVAYSHVPTTNASSSKLQELVNAWAFVPVMNRLIAGGNFTRGTIGGDDDYDTGVFKFDLGVTKVNQGGDFIAQEAHLVFPIRLLYADDRQYNIEDQLVRQDTALYKYSDEDGDGGVGTKTFDTVGTIDVYRDLDSCFVATTPGEDIDISITKYAKV